MADENVILKRARTHVYIHVPCVFLLINDSVAEVRQRAESYCVCMNHCTHVLNSVKIIETVIL